MSEGIDWETVVKRLREILRNRRLSIQTLADRSGLHRRTIDRLLSGETVSIENLGRIEEAIGVRLTGKETPETAAATTGVALSGLNHVLPEEYTGNYLMFRRSFDYPDRVVCSLIELHRDAVSSESTFHETQRNIAPSGERFYYDFEGAVNHAVTVGTLQLIALDDGFVRVITLGRPYEAIGENEERFLTIRGLMHTLNEKRDIGYYPVATPVYLRKVDLSSKEIQERKYIGSFADCEIWATDIPAELDSLASKFFPPAWAQS